MAHPVPGPPALTTADVAVVVPTHDDAAALARTLATIGSVGHVVVVDDGSAGAGRVAEVARAHVADLVRHDRSLGPGATDIGGAAGVAYTPDMALRPVAPRIAPLTAAAVPFLLLSLLGSPVGGRRAAAETATAGVLGLSAIYIACNESFANWQALWFCGVLLMLCVTLLRVRDVRGSE